MGYPMTWQRVLRRNNLLSGGYATAPTGWDTQVNVNSTVDPHAALEILQAQRLRLLRYEKQATLLAGDMRRLEEDARDEQAICEHIAKRTLLGAAEVAAVLKEFFAL